MKLPGIQPIISPQSDMEACVRQGNLDGQPVQHCYMRLVGDNGHIEDSISFGPDELGQPDKRPERSSQCHTILKDIVPASWEKVKRHYREYCANTPFSLHAHDCCSCASDAIRLVGGAPPDFICNANKLYADETTFH